jgi:hypothetical protein
MYKDENSFILAQKCGAVPKLAKYTVCLKHLNAKIHFIYSVPDPEKYEGDVAKMFY